MSIQIQDAPTRLTDVLDRTSGSDVYRVRTYTCTTCGRECTEILVGRSCNVPQYRGWVTCGHAALASQNIGVRP